MTQSVLEMTKDLVHAQIQAGSLAPENLNEVLRSTYESLVALRAVESGESSLPPTDSVMAVAATPMSWKKSITKHAVTCLECGASFKQLSSRHLKLHDLDGRSYRTKYGIPATQSLAARATTALRQQIVQQSRPWEKTSTFMKHQKASIVDETPAAPAKKARAKKKADPTS
jgi:predicted transcriptional regulator